MIVELCQTCGRQLVAPDEVEVATCHACDDALFDRLTSPAVLDRELLSGAAEERRGERPAPETEPASTRSAAQSAPGPTQPHDFDEEFDLEGSE